MKSSMSRKADCWADLGFCHNAPTESLWGSLKRARLHGKRFAARQAAQSEVMDWLAAQEQKPALRDRFNRGEVSRPLGEAWEPIYCQRFRFFAKWRCQLDIQERWV